MIKKKKGKVIWFTGLSGSGKTTLALIIKNKLERKGKAIKIIDGDEIRNTLHNSLTFSKDDILLNNKLIAQIAKKLLSSFDYILVPIISPYVKGRSKAKQIIGNKNFTELFISTPIDECKNRDPKGLYKKALTGEIKNFIGLDKSSPYEIPHSPDIYAETIDQSPEEVAGFIIDKI